ncbi:M13 family peptidase [Sphingomonas sp. KRR8]|uniref:M13 family metallopeptidase n=1 Tax=Sphingomonas sp. KRR8 TaxID=2942996 RepID=UPI00201FCA72|nr:M13-type metalloendopeptidase [Sphingomonas sp. KRR8]URD62118.1 M13 family peptidase [Sphingomonas sp. KRR8]
MKRWLILLGATTALTGCFAPPSPQVEAAAAAEAAATATPDVAEAARPKPTYGDYGFDTAGMDQTVKPGDSFYNYASGTWQKNTSIPADKAGYGSFNVLDDLSKTRTRGIIEEAAKDPSSKIGAAYASFMDEAGIEAKGLAPLKPFMDEVKALKSKADYPALLGRTSRVGVFGPVIGFVGVDDKVNTQYALTVYQGGLGMPDRDYYLKDDPKLAAIRTAYVQHLTNMLNLAGEPNAAARAKAIMALETAIAKAHWTQVQSRDATLTYNKMTVAALNRRAPGFDFAKMLRSEGVNVGEVIVSQPSAMTGIAKVVGAAPLNVLKDQLLIRALDSYASYLPKKFDQERFAFFGTTLSGVPQQEPRWRRAVNFTTGAVADEVSKLYVAKYFPPETKAAADQLVKNVIDAMGRRIDGLAWMAPETKRRARLKLANFNAKIGYPSQWRDYSGLEVRPDDLLGNAMRSNEFDTAYELGKLGGPVRKWEWGMTPMTINAYANFGMAEVVFPAAILQPPFFDPNADPAVNYGGIGAVIGHEISHHFDDQGSKYDETGQLRDWWTPQDLAAFKAATQKLVAQYDAYEIFPGAHVQGALTLGENIGDLAGLTVAYDAYKHSLGGQEAPVIDGMTGDQRFYLGWAQVWRGKYREAAMRQRLITDPHSPNEQRVSVVRNLDPWYNAYSVQPGQKLYLAPEQRVRVW